jgi:hypothetical protein
MTATYEKRGIKFLYPENWKLNDEADSELPCSISLETPDGGAFWAVHLYPADSDADEILKETLAPLRETYTDLEVLPAAQDFEQFPGTAREAMFYCLDFLVQAKLQIIETTPFKILFWYQAEDRDFEKQALVFKAISTSLLNSIE